MLCNLPKGEPTGLPGGKAPLTEVGVVAGGEARPPWAFGLTTVELEGETEGEAFECGDLAGEEVESRSGFPMCPLLFIKGEAGVGLKAAAWATAA